MLTSVHLKNFRGFQDTEVGPLKRVNLIVGENNAGKTGLLEALALLLSSSTQTVISLPGCFRVTAGEFTENFWKWIRYNNDHDRRVEVAGRFSDFDDYTAILAERGVEGPYKAAGLTLGGMQLYTTGMAHDKKLRMHVFSTSPSNPRQDAINYNRVVLKRRKKDVEALMKNVEPRLQAIESLQTGNEPLLHADIGLSEMIPVTQMGQGFNRLLDIYSELMAAEARILLIDEIENGLHYSALPTIWRGLFSAAEDVDGQIFATTHSWECVLAADEAASADPQYGLNLIRLDRMEDNIKATIIDKEALGTAKELHWEMR